MSDTYHQTMKEALAEASRRKSDPTSKDMMVRIEPSRYGGFRVRSFPADLYIDQLADGPSMVADPHYRTMVGA